MKDCCKLRFHFTVALLLKILWIFATIIPYVLHCTLQYKHVLRAKKKDTEFKIFTTFPQQKQNAGNREVQPEAECHAKGPCKKCI